MKSRSFLCLALIFVLMTAVANAQVSGKGVKPFGMGNKPFRGPGKAPGTKEQLRSVDGGFVQTQVPIKELNTNVALTVLLPATKRYVDGAPVVVVVSPAMKAQGSGMADKLSLTDHGFVVINAPWPEGNLFDMGGINCQQALKTTLLFAMGKLADANGKFIKDVAQMNVLPVAGAVGMSHGGNAVITTLEAFPIELKDLAFYVSYESPTGTSPDRLGDSILTDNGAVRYDPQPTTDANGNGIAWDDGDNPYYTPAGGVDFVKLAWDPEKHFVGKDDDRKRGQARDNGAEYKKPREVPGVLYLDGNDNGTFDGETSLDQNGNGQIDKGEDFAFRTFSYQGKKYYSLSVITAAEQRQAFKNGWPSQIATVAETKAFWQQRDMAGGFANLNPNFVNLKVIIYSGPQDHVQSRSDYPHIRAQYDGLRKQGGVGWVKINPSLAYVRALASTINTTGLKDLPANQDVTAETILPYTYAASSGRGGKGSQLFLPVAVCEAADRAKKNETGQITGLLFSGVPVPSPHQLPQKPGKKGLQGQGR